MKLFQQRIRAWMKVCFGVEIAADRQERCDRFIEEALELVQAGGMRKEDVLTMVDYTYGRPVGVLAQEVGGVMVTLSALCDTHGVDLDQAAWDEHDSIWTKVEKIREKQKTKPKGSPLPQYADRPDYSIKIDDKGYVTGFAIGESSFQIVTQNLYPDIHIGQHLKLTKEAFIFQGRLIADGGEAYKLFVSALNGQAPFQQQHKDDIAVDLFAIAMKMRMAQKRQEGAGGWENKDRCSAKGLQHQLRQHVDSGNPIDVGNYAMMLFNRGEDTKLEGVHTPKFQPITRDVRCRKEMIASGVEAIPKSCLRCGLGPCHYQGQIVNLTPEG